MFLYSLFHPLLQTEHMGIESIFTITITTFSPWDDTHLIPPAILWVLKGKKYKTCQEEKVHILQKCIGRKSEKGEHLRQDCMQGSTWAQRKASKCDSGGRMQLLILL